MELCLTRSLWGVLEPSDDAQRWKQVLQAVEREGYTAVECPVGPFSAFKGQVCEVICEYVCIYECVCVCMYVYMYLYMYMCMCIC
jgi:hypothetical protein